MATWGIGKLEKSIVSVLILLFIASLIGVGAAARPPTVSEVDRSGSELQELESLFSGARINATGSPIYGQVVNPLNMSQSIYSPPYADLLMNNSLFMDFDRLLNAGRTPPLAYLNWSTSQTPVYRIRHVIS
ncbi:MAG TPA: hypothetical protein PK918_00380 [Methanotrichaceae archaeon]|nr:hypothetical protein [Methanotrichaceae archaeon]HQI90099.1 hypothetical protein [Methanotrichaceae archaeon]